MSFPFSVQLQGEELLTTTTKNYAIGQRGETVDGRVFHYFKAGEAISYTLGSLGGNKPQFTAGNVHNAHAIGVSEITIDGAADGSPAAGYYDDCLIWLVEAENYPTMRIVKSSAAIAADPFDVTLTLEGITPCALSDDTEVDILPNKYGSALDMHSAHSMGEQVALGVPAVQVANGSYGWVQTWGPCVCVASGTVPGAANQDRTCVWASDGSVGILDEGIAVSSSWQIAGYSLSVRAVGGLWVNLTVDP